MGLQQLIGPHAMHVAIAMAVVAVVVGLFNFLFARPSLPKNAPRLSSDSLPIVGSWSFWSQRWDFVREEARKTASHNFSFFVGNYPVVALTGEAERKLFFEHRGLSFNEGYAALLGGAPNPPQAPRVEEEFASYFTKRLVPMLKGPVLKSGLPAMIRDVRNALDLMKADPAHRTNPFDSIYKIVFQLTTRTVACNEIADDPVTLAKSLKQFENIDASGTPWTIMFPWLPLPAKFARLSNGAALYMTFKRVIDNRKKENRREEDALQYLLDQGDDVGQIITFVLGALFAGQLNSGINAAYIVCYLACNEEWRGRVRAEVNAVADKYCAESDLPLAAKLEKVPIEAWEGEFPMIDLALKDTIRMHMPGTAFRRNITGEDIPLPGKNGEVIPSGAYVAFPVGDMFYSPEIYTQERDWDPSRYLPDRAEDKKQAHAWMGWGAGRHPCLGMRFAKLENNIIVAFFLAYFDEFSLQDQSGKTLSRVPDANRNRHSASKPDKPMFLSLDKVAVTA